MFTHTTADNIIFIFFFFNFTKKIRLEISCGLKFHVFVCVEVLRPSQPNGVMSSAVSLPNHMFTGQA